MKKLFFLYILLIVHFSLYPWRFTPLHAPAGSVLAGWSPLAGRSDYLDLVTNVLFYLPLGTLGFLAWQGAKANWWRWAGLAVGGWLISLVLEVAQAWVPGRSSSIRDLAMNGFGVVGGIAVGAVLSRYWPGDLRNRILPIRGSTPVVLAAAWFVAQCFPFLPIMRLAPLRASLLQLVRPASASWLDLAETFVSCLLLCYLLSGLAAKANRRVVVLAAFLAFPLRLFIRGNSFCWSQVAAAAAAFALSGMVLAGFRGEGKLLAGLALLLIAAKEFSPFVFAAVPSAFYFTPFAGFLEAGRDAAIRITAQKFFLYGSAVWTLREAGLRIWVSTGMVTLLLAAGEATQRYLPGRVPEFTDPLLALLAALLMVWLRDYEDARSA